MTSTGNKIDNETVKNYLSVLSDAFLFHKVQRYDIKGKTLLQTLNKYYLKSASKKFGKLRKNTGILIEKNCIAF